MGGPTDFWDRVAVRYAQRKIGDEAAYAATLDRVRHWLSPQMSVLELGCGTGSTALRLAGAAGRIHATDASGEMIRIARAKAAEQGVATVRFAQATLSEAGAGARFDIVMAFNLLHLLDDLPAGLASVRQSLPEGGLFVSKTPCLARKLWLRPVIGVLQILGKAPPDIGYLSVAHLEDAIRAAGFEFLETGDYPKSLPGRFVVARAV